MTLPLKNRLRAEYILPQEIIEKAYDDRLVELMNRQLMSKIADELYKSKPEIIEKETIKIHYDPSQHYPFGSEDHYRMQAEVFVFTKDELTELIRKVQIEASIQIREQMTLVDNFKNK